MLTGSPRVIDGGMTTTAVHVRMNRQTGDGFADDDVKTTYSDLKPQPNGALLATSDPIHVTAQHMTAHQATGRCALHRQRSAMADRERRARSEDRLRQ